MTLRGTLILPLIAAAMLLTACNAEEKRIQGEIKQLQRQSAILGRRIDYRKGAVRTSENRLGTMNTELTALNSDVHALIFQHRMAVTCLRAASITFGDDNQYSQQIAGAAGWGTILCTIALLDPKFAQEVTTVANRLTAADLRAKDLKQQIAEVRKDLDAETARVRDDEAARDQLTSEIADLQYQLAPE
jgi:peptidoglycan hydrolase CwlO-like protein